jgi:chaperonin GroEL
MSKCVKYSEKARESIRAGVDKVSNAVRITLGPKGRNVLLRRPWGPPHITKDGVTIAKDISLKDQFENMGAEMVKQAASRTVDDAGDGTTTAVLLTQVIYAEGLRMVAAGANPMGLKRGIDKAAAAAVGCLSSMSEETADPERIRQIGTISANGDERIGGLIAEAMEKVGKDGVITIEEAHGLETTLTMVEGMQFDRGYLSSYFVNQPEKMKVELDGCSVLVCKDRMDVMDEVVPFLEMVAQAKRPLLIIAEDVGGTLLPGLVVNKMRGALQVCAVKAPGFGDRREDMLKDIAVLTGATLFSAETGRKIGDAKPEDLGRANRVIVTKNDTTIVGGGGDKKLIQGRIAQIKTAVEEAKNDWDRDKARERLAKMLGGVAIIRVAAPTEAEMKEKRDRVEDAMHATRAAVEEGIVPGGGVALLRCASAVQAAVESLDDDDEKNGAVIVFRSLRAPLAQIAANAGASSDRVVEQVFEAEDEAEGWNASTGEYQDLMKAGVIDPKKVVRCALQNAASTAGLLLTTEAVVADEPEDEKDPHGQGMQGM